MTLEEKVFGRKRFLPDRMAAFGFEKADGGFVYRADIMGGDFSVGIFVGDKGDVKGKVVDNMNDEEYVRFRTDEACGAYVSSVRAAYEELLGKIADGCCRDVPFVSEQANAITGLIYEKYGVRPDFPFHDEDASAGVFRHGDTGKWFGLIMNIKRRSLVKDGEGFVDVMNLKADVDGGVEYKKGVYPAFHMNHKMWPSVTLDDTLPDGEVMALVDKSYALTDKKTKKS